MPVLDSFPTSVRSGDTVKWLHVSPDYSPAEWGLKVYLLTASGKIEVSGVDQGDGTWLCTLAKASNVLAVGQARWAAVVTDLATSSEQWTDSTGLFEVLPNLVSATTHDPRSNARKVLDALEATIRGSADHDQLEITIGDKAVRYLSPLELEKLRKQYKAMCDAELDSERVQRGGTSNNTVRVRFG